jgi:hypothetical protein
VTIIEAVDAVIVKHLGTSHFPPADQPELPGFWARTIVDADLNETLTFGIAADAHAVEKLRRDVKTVIEGIDALAQSTIRYTPTSRSKQAISDALLGREAGSVYYDATQALRVLMDWLTELAKEPAFRRQAKGGRNWRAASVALACRNLWGFGQWHIQGRPNIPGNFFAHVETVGLEKAEVLQREKIAFVWNCAPRTEKLDAPGPFGRFLEEVLETLGVCGREGQRLSAHSALRALSQAVSKHHETS